MSDEVGDLIRELAVEHGVALDRSDPILVVQTATRRILQLALKDAQTAQAEALAQHRSELELVAAKWQADSKRAAAQLLEGADETIAASIARQMDQAAQRAAAGVGVVVGAHEKALARSTLTCALAAAVAVLAAAAFTWTANQTFERLDAIGAVCPEVERAEPAGGH